MAQDERVRAPAPGRHLHVAVMARLGCTRVWSYDAGFDAVARLQRVH